MTPKNNWRNLNLLQELSHQELWKYCAIAKDNSVWQIVALNESKTKIHAKWLSGKTKIGQLDLEGKRIAALTLDDIANIEGSFLTISQYFTH